MQCEMVIKNVEMMLRFSVWKVQVDLVVVQISFRGP
jgi:hypothetical protein